jgi:hypothetical protein
MLSRGSGVVRSNFRSDTLASNLAYVSSVSEYSAGQHTAVSPGQISVGVLQLCILITVSQLTLHAGIATLVPLVLLHRALAPILIPRFVHGCFLPSLNYDTLNMGPPDSPQWKRRIALPTSTNAADKDLNIELMNERAAMLADVGDQVLLMKHDLADLLRGLRP